MCIYSKDRKETGSTELDSPLVMKNENEKAKKIANCNV